jgi:NADH-quinone oxidoreductase subunit E
MLPPELRQGLESKITAVDHPRELAVDVMFALQQHYGYLSDAALEEGAQLLGLTPLELEEIATFYDFIYREPVGRFVIHVCDGVVCWMCHEGWEACPFESVRDYLCRKLAVQVGETTADGLFTILPVGCVGYCDHAPAMLINGVLYGPLTPEKIDQTLEKLKTEYCELVICR